MAKRRSGCPKNKVKVCACIPKKCPKGSRKVKAGCRRIKKAVAALKKATHSPMIPSGYPGMPRTMEGARRRRRRRR